MNTETLSKKELSKLIRACMKTVLVNGYLALAITLYSTGHWIGGTVSLGMIVIHALVSLREGNKSYDKVCYW
jgi:hypothetical protein